MLAQEASEHQPWFLARGREETKSQIFHGAVEYSFQSGPFRLVFHRSNGVLMVPEATRPSITALGLCMLGAVYSRCLRALPCEPQQCFFSSPIHLRYRERVTGERFGIRFRTAITGNGDIDGTAITGAGTICALDTSERASKRTSARFACIILAIVFVWTVCSLVARIVNIIVCVRVCGNY